MSAPSRVNGTSFDGDARSRHLLLSRHDDRDEAAARQLAPVDRRLLGTGQLMHASSTTTLRAFPLRAVVAPNEAGKRDKRGTRAIGVLHRLRRGWRLGTI